VSFPSEPPGPVQWMCVSGIAFPPVSHACPCPRMPAVPHTHAIVSCSYPYLYLILAESGHANLLAFCFSFIICFCTTAPVLISVRCGWTQGVACLEQGGAGRTTSHDDAGPAGTHSQKYSR
jgi:hypothetical protein